jgi:PST family polysaccharide transporter
MVDTPIEPLPRAVAVLRPYVEPALRHAGWFGFFLVLAPIIGPRGYGLFILALSGIAIAEALLAETATAALAGLAELDERHLSTALVTTLGAGAALSLLLHSVARFFSAMVDEAVLGDIFQSLTLLPVLGALAAVPRAMLRRERRHAPFAAASAAGLAAGGGVAIALAWAGAGPWSLVAQIIVQRFLECVVFWGMVNERVGIAWSRRHFAVLIGALDLRALAAAWPAVMRFGPCLAAGLILGPTAAGLYLLASRMAEAVGDICLARSADLPRDSIAETVRHGCQAILPALLASGLLAVAVPPLLDARWWAAVRPAQLLLLAAIPAAVIFMRRAWAGNTTAEPRWRAVEAVGGIAAVACSAPCGLTAIAVAGMLQTIAMAAASLWSIRQVLGERWQEAIAAAARPCAGAAAAGFLLLALADPVAMLLAPLSAVAFLVAAGWLCYVVIRGEPRVAAAEAVLRRVGPVNPA